MEEPIYPMAFKPNTKIKCKLYFVGFPKIWKEKLIEIEKMINTNWNETYSLPTRILNSSLKIWMDDIVEVAMLRAQSNDEDWLVSYEREVNTKILLDHIKTWLSSYYLSNEKLPSVVKEEVRNLMESMNSKELDKLQKTKEVNLFDDQGIPIESYSYMIFPLIIINQLVGKKIKIDGQIITLNYSGKNQLISDIQRKGKYIYSYGISFSLQTIPPNREPLLLCDCCIHRWMVGKWRDKPYFNNENIVAHIWGNNNKIYKIPIQQRYKQEKEYYWKEEDKNYYNLYQFRKLPEAWEVIDDLEYYLSSNTKITCLYKNGRDSHGFKKSQVGTGVSMSDRSDICKDVEQYISELVFPIENIEYIKPTNAVRAELKEIKEVKVEIKEVKGELKEVEVEKAINFNQELTDNQKAKLADRIKKCTKSPTLNFEIYYNDSSEDCAKEILEKFKDIFQSNEEIEFKISLCPLGNIGEPLENKTSSAVSKRINEIQKEVELTTELTACIILLPDKEAFEGREFNKDNQNDETSNQKADPKDAIRCGFALRNRLTQFIVPWNESDLEENNKKESNKEIDSKIISAIEDLCRQLGYIKEMEIGSKKDKLMTTHVIGIHILQIKKTSGKVSLLPLCVELDYISGEVYVECDAFEHPKVLYREAAFELARLSRDKNLEKKCTHAMEEMLRQKMMRWQDIYEEEACLVLIESNKTTRTLYPGITDIQIQQYHYLKPYCPEEINVGTKENNYKLNLNDSKLRFIRLRVNKEVPNYYTKLSTKKEEHVATKGIFKYKQVYWAIARRPNNSAYISSYKETRYGKPSKYFAARDMIEIYPIQLQKDDNPDEWVHYTNSLRLGAIQYDEATIVPLPLHLAKKLQEYILTT